MTEQRFAIYVNHPGGQHLSGYLTNDKRVAPWAKDARTFASASMAADVIDDLGYVRCTGVRPGVLTAYVVEACGGA